MTISKIIDKSKLPNQSQEQDVFDAFWAQLLLDLVDWGTQVNAEAAAMNAAIASFNSALAGNAYAILYNVDIGSTADTDPGTGKLRFNNATQNLATVLRADVISADTADYTKSLDTFDASTSTVKGTLRLVKVGDARKYLLYNVTARSAPIGYRNITVAPIDFSSANPFVNGDSVLMFFQRNGDKGDKGDTGPVYTHPTLYVRDEKPAGTMGGVVTNSLWNTRTLNTTKVNTIPGASLTADQVTIPAGTYDIDGSAPGFSAYGHKVRLFNVTDGVVVDVGTSEHTSNQVGNRTFLKTRRLVLAAPKVFELQHRFGTTNTVNGLGPAANVGEVEVYSELEFRKIA